MSLVALVWIDAIPFSPPVFTYFSHSVKNLLSTGTFTPNLPFTAQRTTPRQRVAYDPSAILLVTLFCMIPMTCFLSKNVILKPRVARYKNAALTCAPLGGRRNWFFQIGHERIRRVTS